MQPLTEKQTQRVWSRVMNAQAVPAADMTMTGETGQTALTPEKLPALKARRRLFPADRQKGLPGQTGAALRHLHQ